MARSMHDMEDELAKIWTLVGELSEQLAANRALVTQLKSRSDNVKGQATHVGAGFPLRRFNVDISDEEFATELEAFASHLVTENQQLQHENKQLNALLKEYEQTLETVMGKFRGVAHASQQHELQLHSYYTSLLHQLQTAHSSAQLHDDTTLSLLLSRLSVMLRSALRISEGEDIDVDSDMAALPAVPGIALGLLNAPSSSSGSGSSNLDGSSPSSPARSVVASTSASAMASGHSSLQPQSRGSVGPSSSANAIARRRAPHFPGSLPGSSGGYKGTDGHSDWAMERETEILRLQAENASLRDILQIAKDSVLPSVVEEAVEAEAEDASTPDPAKAQSRKGSLTAEELSDSAEKEQELRRMIDGYSDEDEDGDSAVWGDGDRDMVHEQVETDVLARASRGRGYEVGTPAEREQEKGADAAGSASGAGPSSDRGQSATRGESESGTISPKSTTQTQARRNSSRIHDRLSGLMEKHAQASRPSVPTSAAPATSATGAASAGGAGKKPRQSRVSLTEADRPRISILKPGSLASADTSAFDEDGVEEFLEKVPSGNTGLAERAASEDSAPSRLPRQGVKAAEDEGKDEEGDAATSDEEVTAPATLEVQAQALEASSTEPAASTDTATEAEIDAPDAKADPDSGDDADRPIANADMDHTPAIEVSSAGEGPAEIDLADAGLPIISTDGAVQPLPAELQVAGQAEIEPDIGAGTRLESEPEPETAGAAARAEQHDVQEGGAEAEKEEGAEQYEKDSDEATPLSETFQI